MPRARSRGTRSNAVSPGARARAMVRERYGRAGVRVRRCWGPGEACVLGAEADAESFFIWCCPRFHQPHRGRSCTRRVGTTRVRLFFLSPVPSLPRCQNGASPPCPWPHRPPRRHADLCRACAGWRRGPLGARLHSSLECRSRPHPRPLRSRSASISRCAAVQPRAEFALQTLVGDREGRAPRLQLSLLGSPWARCGCAPGLADAEPQAATVVSAPRGLEPRSCVAPSRAVDCTRRELQAPVIPGAADSGRRRCGRALGGTLGQALPRRAAPTSCTSAARAGVRTPAARRPPRPPLAVVPPPPRPLPPPPPRPAPPHFHRRARRRR